MFKILIFIILFNYLTLMYQIMIITTLILLYIKQLWPPHHEFKCIIKILKFKAYLILLYMKFYLD